MRGDCSAWAFKRPPGSGPGGGGGGGGGSRGEWPPGSGLNDGQATKWPFVELGEGCGLAFGGPATPPGLPTASGRSAGPLLPNAGSCPAGPGGEAAFQEDPFTVPYGRAPAAGAGGKKKGVARGR